MFGSATKSRRSLRIGRTASAGPGPKLGPHRVAVDDRVLDDDVGARPGRAARRRGTRRAPWLRLPREPRMTSACGGSPTTLAHLSSASPAAAGCAGQVGDPRVLGQVARRARSSIETTCPCAEQLADRREEQRPTAVAGAGLDDPVGPEPRRSAPGTRTGRSAASVDRSAEPRRVPPREAVPERVDERGRAAPRGSASGVLGQRRRGRGCAGS